jgi:2'-5' RNA ligase
MLGQELARGLARAVAEVLGSSHQASRSAGNLARVPAADLHMTLFFAGELEPAVAGRIEAELGQAFAELRPPRLWIAGTDAFARRGRERVLVARVLEPVGERLAELAARAARAAAEAGVALPDAGRPFAAHVTLARIREGRRGERPRVPERFYELEFGLRWQPSAAAWVESPGGGAPYRVVAEFPLAAGPS